MKRIYIKPTIDKMELRQEEKIALCDWPVGFFSSGIPCSQVFADVSWISDICISQFSNSLTSGS